MFFGVFKLVLLDNNSIKAYYHSFGRNFCDFQRHLSCVCTRNGWRIAFNFNLGVLNKMWEGNVQRLEVILMVKLVDLGVCWTGLETGRRRLFTRSVRSSPARWIWRSPTTRFQTTCPSSTTSCRSRRPTARPSSTAASSFIKLSTRSVSKRLTAQTGGVCNGFGHWRTRLRNLPGQQPPGQAWRPHRGHHTSPLPGLHKPVRQPVQREAQRAGGAADAPQRRPSQDQGDGGSGQSAFPASER